MSIDPLTAIFDLGKVAIEKIWPDPTKRAKELRLLEEIKQRGNLEELNARVKLLSGQMNVNAKEAEHKSVFVAGWRPWCGWVGGMSLAYVAVVDPLMRFIALTNGYEGEFPVIDTSITLQVLLGMLGIAGMRSFDKMKNTETNSVG